MEHSSKGYLKAFSPKCGEIFPLFSKTGRQTSISICSWATRSGCLWAHQAYGSLGKNHINTLGHWWKKCCNPSVKYKRQNNKWNALKVGVWLLHILLVTIAMVDVLCTSDVFDANDYLGDAVECKWSITKWKWKSVLYHLMGINCK